nr:MAG TPA: hypothetical protein [Inoviridae sp.]
MTMFRRFKFWLTCRRYFWCRGFCPACQHFEVCCETYLSEVSGLPWEMPTV